MSEVRGSRRAHRKSRAGCVECKRRRVKCDESRPSCSLCIRFRIECVYANNLRSSTTNSPPISTVHSPAVTTLRPPPSNEHSPGSSYTPATSHSSSPWLSPSSIYPQPGSGAHSFSLEDLSIFHHWCTTTCYAIVFSQTGGHIWQNALTHVALQYPYVLYGMLSVTALHCASLNPASKSQLLLGASEYHNKALQGFHSSVSKLADPHGEMSREEDDDKWTALFISTMLNVPYVFAMYGPLHDDHEDAAEPRADRIARTLGKDWIPIMRGVQVALGPNYYRIKEGPLKAIVTVPEWDTFELPESAVGEEDARLLALRATWKNASEADAAIYERSLHILRRCCAWAARFRNDEKLRTEGYNHEWSAPFMWIHISPEEFFVLLQQRQPPALIVFAHFGGLLHQLDHYWWIRGWGQSVVNAVDELLGSFWEPWMAWPKYAVSRGGSA